MGTFMYFPALFHWKSVGLIAYTYFVGSFYHCSFCCNGISYDPEGGLSMVLGSRFSFIQTNQFSHKESMAVKRETLSATSAH